MKKTIAAIAFTASASASAIIGPLPTASTDEAAPAIEIPEQVTYCLSVIETEEGKYLGTCDETRANKMFRREVGENGCAEDQAAFVSTQIEIPSCPTFIQL